jgi:homoserine kinase
VLVLDDLDEVTTTALTGHGWRVVRPGVPRSGAHLY